MLITESWPTFEDSMINSNIESSLELVKKTISSIRNIRAEMNIPMGKEIDIIVKSSKEDLEIFNNLKAYIIRLGKINNISIDNNAKKPDQSASIVINNNEIFIPLKGVIDIEIEIERLNKQLDAYNGRLKNVNKKLNNENFVSRAPKDIIKNEQKKQLKYLMTIEKIEENLKSFQS
jgi:valyl-tRNA synthetase